MNKEYTYTIISDEEKAAEEDVVMIINDFYSNSDFCDYSSAPVITPTTGPAYEIVKEVKEDDKNTYHDISYTL